MPTVPGTGGNGPVASDYFGGEILAQVARELNRQGLPQFGHVVNVTTNSYLGGVAIIAAAPVIGTAVLISAPYLIRYGPIGIQLLKAFSDPLEDASVELPDEPVPLEQVDPTSGDEFQPRNATFPTPRPGW